MTLKVAVLVYPGSNCEKDTLRVLKCFPEVCATPVYSHDKEAALIDFDLLIIPGGFSFGDYLRAGSIAASFQFSDQIAEVNEKGKHILGICNGFQILTELKILPGTLLKNRELKFISESLPVKILNHRTVFSRNLTTDFKPIFPVANNAGFYFCDAETERRLEKNNQILFRYGSHPSVDLENQIAGIINERGNVLGMMPHPERAYKYWHPSNTGFLFFHGLVRSLLER